MKQTIRITTDENQTLEITITESYKRSIKIKKVTNPAKKK